MRALLDSANDFIAKSAPVIVRDRRRRYVAAQRAVGAEREAHGPPAPHFGSFGPDFVVDWTGLRNARVLIVGDPGEADASQYATLDPLLDIHQGGPRWARPRSRPSDFMILVSDIVYPAGDVNDYLNAFYIPYASYDRPIYALPGNHDWYDGLDGFMFHFCRSEPLPRQRYSARGRRPRERILRGLWRRAGRPDRDLLDPYIAARNRLNGRGFKRAAPRPVQPGPYFAIELKDLLIVAIDPGVSGELDSEQGDWLKRMSARPKPKVLLTGKPIWADGRHHPLPIVAEGCTKKRSVDEIVRDPNHRYVAVIGADTHNYQRYSVTLKDGRTLHYFVAGGGGAYLAPTHTIPTIEHDGDEGKVFERDFRCYPRRGDSLALFCRRVGPLAVKVLASTLLIAAAAAGLLLLAPLDDSRRFAALLAGGAAPAALAVPVVVTATRRFSLLPATVALVVSGVVAALVAIGDARATVAMAVATAVPILAVLAVVVAYAARGSLPAAAPDWLLVVPLLALPPAVWAPYRFGAGLDALAYGLAPVVAAIVLIPLVGRLRAPHELGRHAVHRALIVVLWAVLAAVVMQRFGERWMMWTAATLLGLDVVLGFLVPRLGPTSRQSRLGSDYVLGPPAAVVAAVSVWALSLTALEASIDATAAAVIQAGAAAVVGLLAVAAATYLLVRYRLADPRVLLQLRTGNISPAEAADFMAMRVPASRERTDLAKISAAKARMARVVHGMGAGVAVFADSSAPPFFKSFLSAEIGNGQLELRAWGVTGYDDPQRSPSLEDVVSIPLTQQGAPTAPLAATQVRIPAARNPEPPPRPNRLDLTFRVRGIDCAGWLYPPAPEAAPAPCVILAHGFGGVREQALDRYAERFHAEGLAAFVFDYRHFGASGGAPSQLMSNRRQLQDWRAAIEFVRGLDCIDPERIALWGTSNSGGHVLKLAAADPLIRAVVAQAPFISGLAQLRSTPIPHLARLLWAGLLDQLGALLGRSPTTIKLVGQPYTRAVTTTRDALSGLDQITPDPTNWDNKVCARFALTAALYSAGGAARRLRCPLLVCVADGDDVIPLGPAVKLGERKGTLRRYPSSHFALYYGKTFDAASRDQAEFLRRHLLDPPPRRVPC